MGNTTCRSSMGKTEMTTAEHKKIILDTNLHKNLDLIDKLDPNLQQEAIQEWLKCKDNRDMLKTIWKNLLTLTLSPENLTPQKAKIISKKLYPLGEDIIYRVMMLPEVKEKLILECISKIKNDQVKLSFPYQVYQDIIDNQIYLNREIWLEKLQQTFFQQIDQSITEKIEEQSKSYDKIITLDEQTIAGSLGSLIQENVGKKVTALALPDEFIFENLGRDKLLDKNNLSVRNILSQIKNLLK